MKRFERYLVPVWILGVAYVVFVTLKHWMKV